MVESNSAETTRLENGILVLTPHSEGGMKMGSMLFVIGMIVGGLAMLFFGHESVEWWNVPIGIVMVSVGLLLLPPKRRPVGMRAFSGQADASYRRAS